MHLKPFDYFKPATPAEFFEIAAQYQSGRYVLMGGGTDILVKTKHRLIRPSVLISLQAMAELNTIEHANGNMIIGAGVRLRQINESELIRQHLPALSQAAGWVASPQIRTMGTIGGNVCLDTRCLYYNQMEWACSFAPCFKRGGDICHVVKKGNRCYALFCADTPPALLSMDARLIIAGPFAKREIPLSEFYQDDGCAPRKLGGNELLVGIKIPLQNISISSYRRFSIRHAIDFPVVGVAVHLPAATLGGHTAPAIAATGIQSRPIRLESVEAALKNEDPTQSELGAKIEAGLKEVRLIRHGGISPGYKREILKALIQQGIQDCIQKGDYQNEKAG